jgi:hypothetical protein
MTFCYTKYSIDKCTSKYLLSYSFHHAILLLCTLGNMKMLFSHTTKTYFEIHMLSAEMMHISNHILWRTTTLKISLCIYEDTQIFLCKRCLKNKNMMCITYWRWTSLFETVHEDKYMYLIKNKLTKNSDNTCCMEERSLKYVKMYSMV